ncbi:MAG: tandem-95 repeat protein [Planctomycetaceae bacterium]|nr:tandem-95 repeat protein [Planctomycetales bacterium]MCB9941384.1 tandem-95 repeat protein [Planctomycetaceae bacterium]
MNKLSRRFSGLFRSRKHKKQRSYRSLRTESLENRMMLAGDVFYSVTTNPFDSEDVNRDGHVTALDALAVINAMSAQNSVAQAEGSAQAGGKIEFDVDVNADGHLSPIDALKVINELNAEGEGPNGEKAAYTPITLAPTSTKGSRNLFFDYVDNGSNDQVVRSAGSWITDGFAVGNKILISDSGQYVDNNNGLSLGIDPDTGLERFATGDPDIHVHNNGLYTIQSLTATTLTLDKDLTTVFPARARLDGDLVEGQGLFDNTASFFRVIDTISPGGSFLVGALVEDLRTVGDTGNALSEFKKGPFSAYLDVTFDNTLAAPTGTSVANVSFFNLITSQTSAGLSTPGLIDDAGGVAFSNPGLAPNGAGMQLIWTTPFTAGNSGGTVVFASDPADGDSRDTLLFGSDFVVPTNEIIFNTATLTIAADIAAVNDGPLAFDEGSSNNNINVLGNDTVTNPAGANPTITQVNGAAVTVNQNIALSNGSLTFLGSSKTGANFRYTPAAGNSAGTSFTYTISNGQTPAKTATATVTITINPVDDRPVIAGPSSLSTNEDTALALSGFTITDPDSTNITVTLSASAGSLSQTTFSGTPAEVTTTLNSITYTPVANSNAAATLNISANDGGLTGTKSVAITINPVNDPPVNVINGLGTPPAVTVSNVGTHTFPSGTFQVTDVDAGSSLNVTVSVLHGTLTSGGNTGASLSFSGSSPVNIGSIVYDPTDGYTGSDTLTIMSSDGTLTDTDTVALTVAPPQFPFVIGDTYTSTEGAGTITLTPSPLNNDLKDSGATLTATPASGSTAQGGSFTISGSTFTYTPPADENFFGTDTFTYTIEQDAAHTPSSTGNTNSTGTVTIEIQGVNDVPTLTVPGAQTVSEDPQSPLSITGITVADVDGDTLTVTLNVSNGSLSSVAPIARSGASLTLSGTAANVNTALAGLTYSPTSNFNGSDSVAINVGDGNGGTVSKSVAITVTAQNDDPTITVPGAQQFFRDISNSLSSAIVVADVDAASGNVRVNLTIGTGTLAVSTTNGVQVANITNGISLTGSVASVNTALATLRYSSTASGNFTLTAAVNDLGNTGNGGGQDVTRTIAVEVLDFVPARITGQVFVDGNGNGTRDAGEGVGKIVVTLTGTDFRGNTVNRQTETKSDGTYEFLDVPPNQSGKPYIISQQQSSFFQGSGTTAQVNLDLQGNQTVTGSLGSPVEFTNEFESVYKLFALHGQQTAGVLFGVDGGQQISMLEGEWANGRYANARFAANADGSSGTLTVFDNQLQTDRVATVSTAAGTLTFRGNGTARVYRVVGTPTALLSGASSEGEGTQASSSADATTNVAAFVRGVDSIFASGGV